MSTATLSALPPLLPLLIARNVTHLNTSTSISPAASTSSASGSVVDAHALRAALHALLPAGGIIERLGDARERPREKARETFALLGGYAYRCNPASSSIMRGKDTKGGPETPLMIFERFLKEGGLSSKVSRVREQSILTLVQIRKAHHMFPIRPYLPLLVEALEDSDPSVRETAKVSVAELFTGPGVTDAARADLKKEMTKKGVRKTIVESLLAKVLAGGPSTPAASDAGSENGDAGYIPPSQSLSKRPGLNSSMSRSVSQPNPERSRPASRAAAAPSSTLSESVIGGGISTADVKPVYVSGLGYALPYISIQGLTILITVDCV